MAFQFTPDESLQEGLRRIAAEELIAAAVEAEGGRTSEVSPVHQIRKRCKRMRGLLRLVEPGFADFCEEDVALRDLARTIVSRRDRESMNDALDRLQEPQVASQPLEALRLAVNSGDGGIGDASPEESRELRQAAATARSMAHRARNWSLDGTDEELMTAGLRSVYQAARKSMRQAERTRATDDLHGWRKFAKYHWYHVRLVNKSGGRRLRKRSRKLRRLTELLGQDHDLAVLRRRAGSAGLQKPDQRRVRRLIRQHRRRLQERAFRLGQRLFRIAPSRIVDRCLSDVPPGSLSAEQSFVEV